MISRRTKRIAALAVGLSLIAAACGDDDDSAGDDTASESAPDSTEAPESTEAPVSTEAPSESSSAPDTTAPEESSTVSSSADTGAEMRVTYTLSDTAVWNDGSPISAADIECTWLASVNTPESLSTVGYDQITSVTEGATPQEVVVEFATDFAAWKTLFNTVLQASQHADCNDVSTDFNGAYTYGANPYMMTEWTPEQIVFEANPDYTGPNVPKTPKIVIVPAEDAGTLLKAGTVDFVYPQFYAGIEDELADPNIATDRALGGQFEALYFQEDDACVPSANRSCAFMDDTFREAFSKSIDIDALFEQIYAPFADGEPRLNCGPIAPGRYCDPVFQDTYDPEGAVALLEEAGWAKGADGFWAKDGEAAPVIYWMVNTGNTRREDSQSFLIPLLAEAGFNVVADNCEALPCVFETRLPALEYDLAMFINTVAPDPAYLSTYHCNQIPSEENDFQGQNQMGWCNEEASAQLDAADAELDEEARVAEVKSVLAAMAADHALIPTLQFPNLGAYRSDRVAGTQSNLANYWAFKDWWNFEDLDGDGQVVIGAEQFPTPDCTNPITNCANSSWFVWVGPFPQFPGLYASTDEQTFEPSEFLAGEAVLEDL